VRKPQWITIAAAALLVAFIFLFGRTIPKKKILNSSNTGQGIENGLAAENEISTDSLLLISKKQLSPDLLSRLNKLEQALSKESTAAAGQTIKDHQLHVFHQLARFWSDSARIFVPFAWYNAEAARLENSGKSLTFAARLFLNNLQNDEDVKRRKWKALQAKDLFERSLKINPDDDSAKVDLGACYFYGGISATPMDGILKIREVVEKDSTNIYAQMMMIQGALLSGQIDKAINRLQLVNRLQPANADAVFLLADSYDRTGDKSNAVIWYQKSLPLIKQQDVKAEIEKRIKELQK
jgi:tetratricopeptide (TPR) repeat protein